MQEYDWPCLDGVNAQVWSAVSKQTWLLEANSWSGNGVRRQADGMSQRK